MREYRDDLTAAHLRIKVLEEALAGRPQPAPEPARAGLPLMAWLVIFSVSTFVLWIVAVPAIRVVALSPGNLFEPLPTGAECADLKDRTDQVPQNVSSTRSSGSGGSAR